jgi:hypothetical protein
MESGAACAIPGPRPPLRRHLATIDPSLEAILDDVATLTASHRTLEDVARWALVARPPRVFAAARRSDLDREDATSRAPGFDLVVQDEYTHDVTVPWGARELYVVYDTT